MSTTKKEASEKQVHFAICTYIKNTFKDMIFISEASGVKLTMGQAVSAKNTRSDGKLPDLIILEARAGYHGLVIEVKKDAASAYDKHGKLKKNKHVQGQYQTLKRLKMKGYFACFGLGYSHSIEIVNKYMAYKQPLTHFDLGYIM